MATTISDNTPDRSEEATMGQLGYIHNLLEGRRVSGVCAAKIITLLLSEPVLNDTGMDMLKKIQKPE